MREQQRPYLLFHQFRGAGPKHPLTPGLVDFDFVEGQFDLPALRIRRGELDRGGEVVVADRGNQAERAP
jgi:hypothetical protein